MISCSDLQIFAKYINEIDQAVEVELAKDQKLRVNVWETTPQQVEDMINNLSLEGIPETQASQHITNKIDRALKRIKNNAKKATKFNNKILSSPYNIEMTIALDMIMETVRGEVDKARNNNIEISKLAADGVLPAIPLSRTAASIGRKIAFQKGYRFKADKRNGDTAADIEYLYHNLGMMAIQHLEEQGFISTGKGTSIKDYIFDTELNNEKIEIGVPVDGELTVRLNEKTIGIKPESIEADYFLSRGEVDTSNSKFGAMVDTISAIRQITQPATISAPDTEATKGNETLAKDDVIKLAPTDEEARQKIYENPLYVHSSIHDLMKLFHQEIQKTGKLASEIMQDEFKGLPGLMESLFGIKASQDFSIDKKESIRGQNLSRTTPMNDTSEYYSMFMDDKGERLPLHMTMFSGRNDRLYYNNSILNPHGSKHSRYSLTAGTQEIEVNSDDFEYLVYNIGDHLDSSLTFDDITGKTESKLDKALALMTEFNDASTLNGKLAALSVMPEIFPNVDYATLLTTLQAVQDIRNPINGVVKTEFMVSADATASGGTITFMQALGTSDNVSNFLKRIGILKGGKQDLNDLYGLLTEAIKGFTTGERKPGQKGYGIGPKVEERRVLLKNTIEMIFEGLGKDVRELSKDPTMTFVYGQGEPGAIKTMANSLANRVIDNMAERVTKDYIALILDNPSYKNKSFFELRNEKDLHTKLVKAITKKGIPKQLFDLMDQTVNKQYLKDFKERSAAVWELVQKLPKDIEVNILPAGAVMDGITPTKENLDRKFTPYNPETKTPPSTELRYGMPLMKVFEIATKVNGETVLTRRNKLRKTVMDVSPIHSIDAAQLYRSVAKVVDDKGVVVVHDEIRGTVKDVRAVEAEYAKQTAELIAKYDVHEQVMRSIAVYDPELAKTPEYKKVWDAIVTDQIKKQEALNDFNETTGSIIGTGDKYKEFAKGSLPGSTKAEKTTTSVNTTETAQVPQANTETKAETTTQEVKPEATVDNTAETAPDTTSSTNRYKADATPIEVSEAQVEAYKAKYKAQGTKKTKESVEREVSVRYINAAVSSILNSQVERRGKKVFKRAHDLLMEYPMYSEAIEKLNGFYDTSEALQQLVHTITGEGIDKIKKADLLAKFAKITSDRTETTNYQLKEFNKITRGMTQEQIKDASDFITKLPLHDYFTLADGITTGTAIDAEVKRLEKALGNTGAIKIINSLIDMNVDGNITGDTYNLETSFPVKAENAEYILDIQKLLALKSIQRIGTDKFEAFLENENLVTLVKDHVIANKLSLMENEGTGIIKDSMLTEVYKEPFQSRVIELKDLKNYEYGDNNGWKILRRPEKGKLGIVYRPVIDSTSIDGAFTDIKLRSGDINVNSEKAEYPGVVRSPNGHKLILTHQEKLDLGMVEDFGQVLVKNTAHNLAIQDSQVIRDEVLKKETRYTLDASNIADLQARVESDNIDNPWFVKIDSNIKYSEMPASIRARYMPVGNRVSNVKNFNNEVDWVRKDISHWLLGGRSSSLFENPKMRWAMRITKGLISGAKIGMVVLNPIKIAQDNVSNLAYLGTMGVTPMFAAKHYKSITDDYNEFLDIQNNIIKLKVQLAASPNSTKLQQQVKTLQNRLKRNPLGDLEEKGFIGSLGSNLTSRHTETGAGFQKDAHTALTYILKNNKGNKNILGHFINEFQKVGFNSEDLINYLGSIVTRNKTAKFMEKELDEAVERMKEIRSEEDMVNYVAQFTNSPDSELVRFGSSMTDLTDILAKETLYRHLVENDNMKPEDARIKVLDSFPDYKENMPLAVKQLSDMGIIMFPSFWLRIQKVIYRMIKERPVSTASEMLFEQMMGGNVNTIIDANIINKSESFGGLFHTPYESVGINSFIPTHLF